MKQIKYKGIWNKKMVNSESECSEVTPWAKWNSTNPWVGCGHQEREKAMDPQMQRQESILTGMEIVLTHELEITVCW